MKSNEVKYGEELLDVIRNLDSIYYVRLIHSSLLGQYQGDLLKSDTFYPVDITRYAEVCNVCIRTAYTHIVELAIELKTKDAGLTLSDGTVLLTNIVSEVLYKDSDMTISLKWTERFIPLISGRMKAGKFLMANTDMDSTPSNRRYLFYTYLAKNLWEIKKKGSKMVLLKELREVLGVEEHEYEKFTEFRRRVLDPALEDIRRYTGIEVEYEGINHGKKIGKVVFTLPHAGLVELEVEPDPLLQLTKLQELGQAKSSNKTGSTRSYSKRLG